MPDYTDLATMRLALKMEADDTTDDTRLSAVITAASRAIEAYTGRVFYATTATKYFQADAGCELLLDEDLLSVTSLKTDEDGDRTYEITWAATDYDLEPANSAPYTRIHTTPRGNYSFPLHRRGVEIVGSWGYCATGSHPETIEEACILQAVKLFKRPEAPFGVLGTPETGVVRVPRMDADVKALLGPYVRIRIA